MKREATDLIVLHVTKFGDSALIVHALSPLYGRCGLIIKGVGAGKKNRRAAALFQPLNVLETVVDENPKSSLLSIRSAELKYNLASIRGNILKNCISVFLSELLYRLVSEGSREEGLFEWTENMICAFEGLECDFSNFHIYFSIRLCGILGFSPNRDSGYRFSDANEALLGKFLSNDFAGCMALPATGEMRSSFMEDMVKYLEYHIDKPLEIKSLKILHELLC